MSLRVYLHPEPDVRPEAVGNGISRVVTAMHKYLPAHGIELVPSRDHADLCAAHVDLPSGIPDVLHCHGLYPTGEMEIGNWAYEINKRVIDSARQAKAVTVPSPWVAQIFERNLGFSPRVVRHGIEPDEWPEPPKRSELTVLWNKNRPGDVCAVEPVERLAQLRPNVKFVSTFGKSRRNLDITGATSFPAMKELLYKCGIYYAPTKETYGIGILEAMAAGMPVLTWNWGSAPELVRHMVDGYIVEPYDYMGTARGLDWCIEHFDEISPRARAHALKFTWDEPMRLYAQLYQSTAERLQAKGPLVSVVITCYNYGKYVAEAIQSVKSQTLVDWECVVVDDGSTDDSLEVIKKATQGDDRFKIVSQPNSRVADARNRGAVMSAGRYLCFLDADDYMLPRCLEILAGALVVDRTMGIAYGRLEALNEETKERVVGEWPGEFNMAKQLERHNQVPACCLMDARAFFRAGGVRNHAIPTEDAELWTRIVLLGFNAAQVTKEPLYVYRKHGENATAGIGTRGGPTEPNWTAWLPAANGGVQPIASVLPPRNSSHPVYNYDKPLVSFITPVGPGHERLVTDAIESVSAQLDHRWEHIIVDDTEKGDLQSYGVIPYGMRYPYLRWLRSSKLHNVSAARNEGARAARGRYICFLDADDMLFKEFLTEALVVITQVPRALVYTDWIELPEVKVHSSEPWDSRKLMDHALFAVTFLHEKRCFVDVGGFDETLDVWEDWDYIVRLSFVGCLGVHIPKPLFSYRYNTGKRREESLAKAQERMKNSLLSTMEAPVPPVVQPSQGPTRRAIQRPVVQGPREVLAVQPRVATSRSGHVAVRYVGVLQATRSFRVAGGRRYRFGPGPQQVQSVVPEDVAYFKSLTGLFVVEEQKDAV